MRTIAGLNLLTLIVAHGIALTVDAALPLSRSAAAAAAAGGGGAVGGAYSISYNLRQHASPRCPRGFQKEPRHVRRCYKVVLLKASWVAAKGYCEAIDSVLAEVASSQEHRFLVDEINSQLLWRPKLKAQRQQFWLGATDLAYEGQWRWLADNRPIEGGAYANWASRQPDMKRKHEHCLAMRSNTSGASARGVASATAGATRSGDDYKWHDISCYRRNFFICYKKLDA